MRSTFPFVTSARNYGQKLADKRYLDVVKTKPLKPVKLERFTPEAWKQTVEKVLWPDPDVRKSADRPSVVLSDIYDESLNLKADRWARDAERGTLIDFANRDKRLDRWGRFDPEPPTCVWCTILISRGSVYLTKETAEFHTGCTCDVILVPKGQPNPMQDVIDAAFAEYQEGVSRSGSGDLSDISAAMKAARKEAKG